MIENPASGSHSLAPKKNLNKESVTKEMKMSQRQRCQQMLLHLVIKKLGHSIRPESTKNETLEADPGLGSRVTIGQTVHRKDRPSPVEIYVLRRKEAELRGLLSDVSAKK